MLNGFGEVEPQDVVDVVCRYLVFTLVLGGTLRSSISCPVSCFLPWREETEVSPVSPCTGVGSGMADFPIESVYLQTIQR